MNTKLKLKMSVQILVETFKGNKKGIEAPKIGYMHSDEDKLRQMIHIC